jgi:hypothetical protein
MAKGKGATHAMFLRVPEDVFADLKRLADLHDRSVAGESTRALRLYVRRHREELEQEQPKGRAER